MSFSTIKIAVQNLFDQNKHRHLFTTGVDKGVLNDAYLSTFTDPVERQHHNCNCCRSFLNQYGDIVWIEDEVVKTLWDFELPSDNPYAAVPATLRSLVLSKPIQSVYFSQQAALGTDRNFGKLGEKWEHFHIRMPSEKVRPNSLGKDTGYANDSRALLLRSLKELKLEHVNEVLELIAQNQLYRGPEHKASLLGLQKLMTNSQGKDLELFSWEFYAERGARARNTVIGEILIDLAEGKDLEDAVKSYERMVAPANYRRPTAAVTAGMLDKAKKELEGLGMLNSLQRRLANKDDIPLSEALWVNRPVAGPVDLFAQAKQDLPFDPPKGIRELTVDEFKELVKSTNKLEVLFESRLLPNFVNLTAAVDPDSPNLFNWNNSVAWAYQGGLADSIKERVKKAGGNVEGDVRVSLSWFNYDDLDLSVIEQPTQTVIYFSNPKSINTGGHLDVDENAGSGITRTPVENIAYADRNKMEDGRYEVWVKNFRKRESIDVGFDLEIEIDKVIHTFSHPAAVKDNHRVKVATINKRGDSITVEPHIAMNVGHNMKMSELCGLRTRTFHEVNMLLPSPNFWSGCRNGNEHLFFIIDDAVTDQPVRGFFNEYLSPRLSEHRKVFELLGSKVMIPSTTPQLAGLGFSSTIRNHLVVRADSVVYQINF